jgi:hypothetical protein
MQAIDHKFPSSGDLIRHVFSPPMTDERSGHSTNQRIATKRTTVVTLV